MSRRKPLTRHQSARAIIDFYDDLTNSEIRKLPAVERDLYFAAIDFFQAKAITKPKRKPRPIRRRIRKPKPRPRGRRHVPPPKPPSIVDDYPELDVLDDLEEMINDVLESEGDKYHSE